MELWLVYGRSLNWRVCNALPTRNSGIPGEGLIVLTAGSGWGAVMEEGREWWSVVSASESITRMGFGVRAFGAFGS